MWKRIASRTSPRLLSGLGLGLLAVGTAVSLTVGWPVGHASEPALSAALSGSARESQPAQTSATVTLPATTPPARPAQPARPATESPSPARRVPTATAPSPTRPAPPKARPTPAPPQRAAAQPPRKAPVVARPTAKKPSTASGPTGWGALDAAIGRIPGYWQGGIHWSVTSRYGHYGTTDLATADIYISPGVPTSLLDSVVRHEYAHVVSVRAYGGQWQTTVSALNRAFGGSGMTGAERAADCMARAIGATWTYHTSCSSSSWRSMAAQLLAGHRV